MKLQAYSKMGEIIEGKLIRDIYLKVLINPLLANVPILYPLKTSENLWFKMGTLAGNGLKGCTFTETRGPCKYFLLRVNFFQEKVPSLMLNRVLITSLVSVSTLIL